MTTTKFLEEACKVGQNLSRINDRVRRTMEVLERLVHSEEVNVSEWAVRAGNIYITFDAIAELEHAPESERHIQETLAALFPTCRISGTLLEIEYSELL